MRLFRWRARGRETKVWEFGHLERRGPDSEGRQLRTTPHIGGKALISVASESKFLACSRINARAGSGFGAVAPQDLSPIDCA